VASRVRKQVKHYEGETAVRSRLPADDRAFRGGGNVRASHASATVEPRVEPRVEQRPKSQGNVKAAPSTHQPPAAARAATAAVSSTAVGEVAPRDGKLANAGRRVVALLEEAARLRADGQAGDAERTLIEAFEIKPSGATGSLGSSILARHACMLRCLNASTIHQQSDVHVPTVRSIAHLNCSLSCMGCAVAAATARGVPLLTTASIHVLHWALAIPPRHRQGSVSGHLGAAHSACS
jgi:hypothetical protein